ncbi:MAG: hypothetical protein J6X94_14090 [Lachnospiraceae bacterium]|nr:hypothetical protein [Lachnospiraceae bacterium]
MENENEVLEVTKQEIRSISDKTQSIIFTVAGAVAMILGPILLSGLFGWVLCLTGFIFVILGICGFVYVSDDAKREKKKD